MPRELPQGPIQDCLPPLSQQQNPSLRNARRPKAEQLLRTTFVEVLTDLTFAEVFASDHSIAKACPI
jgi:hypothetical protein